MSFTEIDAELATYVWVNTANQRLDECSSSCCGWCKPCLECLEKCTVVLSHIACTWQLVDMAYLGVAVTHMRNIVTAVQVLIAFGIKKVLCLSLHNVERLVKGKC